MQRWACCLRSAQDDRPVPQRLSLCETARSSDALAGVILAHSDPETKSGAVASGSDSELSRCHSSECNPESAHEASKLQKMEEKQRAVPYLAAGTAPMPPRARPVAGRKSRGRSRPPLARSESLGLASPAPRAPCMAPMPPQSLSRDASPASRTPSPSGRRRSRRRQDRLQGWQQLLDRVQDGDAKPGRLDDSLLSTSVGSMQGDDEPSDESFSSRLQTWREMERLKGSKDSFDRSPIPGLMRAVSASGV